MLTLDDIQPGIVAWLDPAALADDRRVQRIGAAVTVFRPGPFLCVAFTPGRTWWLNLTTQPGSTFHLKTQLLPHWWDVAGTRWRVTPCYINDVRQPFVGRDVAFLGASCEDRGIWTRPKLSATGLRFITDKMRRFGIEIA